MVGALAAEDPDRRTALGELVGSDNDGETRAGAVGDAHLRLERPSLERSVGADPLPAQGVRQVASDRSVGEIDDKDAKRWRVEIDTLALGCEQHSLDTTAEADARKAGIASSLVWRIPRPPFAAGSDPCLQASGGMAVFVMVATLVRMTSSNSASLSGNSQVGAHRRRLAKHASLLASMYDKGGMKSIYKMQHGSLMPADVAAAMTETAITDDVLVAARLFWRLRPHTMARYTRPARLQSGSINDAVETRELVGA